MRKDKRLFIIGAAVIVLACVIALLVSKLNDNKGMGSLADKTQINVQSSYRMDLRIFGTVNDARISKIILIDNYKNTDKLIQVKDNDFDTKYFAIKANKKYQYMEDKYIEVDNTLYENTDVYLSKINYVKFSNEKTVETIGDNNYKVRKGTISSKHINELLRNTDLELTTNSDANVEVWLNAYELVYKVYYRFDDLTIYASYFNFNLGNEVDLSVLPNTK